MTQIAIPAGVNPAAAIPADAVVHERSAPGVPAGPTVPPVAPSNEQKPGFVPAPAGVVPPAGADADEFAAFKAWQAAQQGKVTPPAPAAPAPKPAAPANADFAMGADAALEATKQAAQADTYLAATFSMFEMVAPEVDLARAVGNAIDRGDPSLIDVKYLTEKGGDKAAKLIEVAKGLVAHTTETVARLTTEIHTKAGGEANWNAAVAVFNQQAPKYLREFVAQSIDSANPSRITSAVESMLDFVKNSGALPRPPEGHVRAGGGAPNAALGLSKADYQAERMKLDRRARDFPEKERELTARRALGKSMGL